MGGHNRLRKSLIESTWSLVRRNRIIAGPNTGSPTSGGHGPRGEGAPPTKTTRPSPRATPRRYSSGLWGRPRRGISARPPRRSGGGGGRRRCEGSAAGAAATRRRRPCHRPTGSRRSRPTRRRRAGPRRLAGGRPPAPPPRPSRGAADRRRHSTGRPCPPGWWRIASAAAPPPPTAASPTGGRRQPERRAHRPLFQKRRQLSMCTGCYFSGVLDPMDHWWPSIVSWCETAKTV